MGGKQEKKNGSLLIECKWVVRAGCCYGHLIEFPAWHETNLQSYHYTVRETVLYTICISKQE